MKNRKRKSGFTLTEVLISAGILSVGFMLIAGAFPVGVKLTSMATERTIGSIAAQEAVAKIKIYGLDMSYWSPYYADPAAKIIPLPPNVGGLTYGNCIDYSNVALLDWEAITADPTAVPPYLGFEPVLPLEDEYYYPSTNLADEKKYHWSALCRRTSNNQILATIFVSRLAGPGVTYPVNPIPTDTIHPDFLPLPTEIEYPQPYMISGIERDPDDAHRNWLTIPTVTLAGDPADYSTYFREGSVICKGSYKDLGNYRSPSCQLYTVKEVNGTTVVLDRDWSFYYANPDTGDTYYYTVWVLPSSIKTPGTGGSPPILGGRWPCVWIFQDIIEVSDFSQIVPVP